MSHSGRTGSGSSEVEKSIALYAQKLNETGNGGEVLSKRQKKRALQKLGKLKKQQVSQENGNKEGDEDNGENNESDSDGEQPAAKVQKQEQPTLSKKELKVKLRILNQELAEFAQKKQLKLAKKKFQWALNKGYKLDVHSYTNLINVYVRCNDMTGATSVADEMKSLGINPNVITYTTLLKGYTEMGKMKECRRILFEDLPAGGITPNVRTLNAFLRGCARTGDVKSAYKAFIYFKELSKSNITSTLNDSDNENDNAPDASTYEYIVGILCRSGHIATAENIVAEFIASNNSKSNNKASAGGVDVMENSAIYLTLAKSLAIVGKFEDAKKWLLLTQNVLKMNQNVELKDNMLKRFQNSTNNKEESGGNSRSVALFLNHRRSELQNESQLLEDFLASIDSYMKGVTNSSSGNSGDDMRAKSCQLYLKYLSQVLYFGYDGKTDYDDVICGAKQYQLPNECKESEYNEAEEITKIRGEVEMEKISAKLLLALRDKFGMCEVSNNIITHLKGNKELQKILKKEKVKAMDKINESIDGTSGYLVFEKIFQQFVGLKPVAVNTASTSKGTKSAIADMYESMKALDDATEETSTDLELPIKLEICSGNGEWVVAQAAADRGAFATSAATSSVASKNDVKAVWIALELRCDRIHSTLCQNIFYSHELVKSLKEGDNSQNINNLAVISGDASKIIPQRFPPARLSAIFINHPQPPDRVTGGAKDKNQGAHLLTIEFFVDLHRVLKKDGTITIVTDNQLYAKSLAEELVEMTEKTFKVGKSIGFVSVKLEGDATKSLQETLKINTPANIAESHCIQIWRGDPGSEAGHVSAASSYFDRMWDLGQKKRRWFLFVKKL